MRTHAMPSSCALRWWADVQPMVTNVPTPASLSKGITSTGKSQPAAVLVEGAARGLINVTCHNARDRADAGRALELRQGQQRLNHVTNGFSIGALNCAPHTLAVVEVGGRMDARQRKLQQFRHVDAVAVEVLGVVPAVGHHVRDVGLGVGSGNARPF